MPDNERRTASADLRSRAAVSKTCSICNLRLPGQALPVHGLLPWKCQLVKAKMELAVC